MLQATTALKLAPPSSSWRTATWADDVGSLVTLTLDAGRSGGHLVRMQGNDEDKRAIGPRKKHGLRFALQVALLMGALTASGCYESRLIGSGGLDGAVRPDAFHAPDGSRPPDGMVTECEVLDAPVLAPIVTLVVPLPPVSGEAGIGIGHDLDGVNDACGVMDYANSVDNAFLDLAAALPALNPDQPIIVQEALNDSLACVLGDPTCRPLDLGIRVSRGAGCAEVALLDGEGEVFESPGVGLLDANGNFRVEVPSFPLTFHFTTSNGPVEVPLRMRDVIITGRVVGEDVVDIIIGGSLQKGEFEATVRAMLPLLDGDIVFEDVAPILASLYDIGPVCTALSIGLVANSSGAL